MSFSVHPYRARACCLCGSESDLSGEHKIKASALRSVFGKNKMVIGHFDEPADKVRQAQSPKSREFHFASRICRRCNSDRTQRPDREFDRFHTEAMAKLQLGIDPAAVVLESRYEQASEANLNVLRYFAKLLACHMADLEAPRLAHLTRFAIGEAHQSPIWLEVDRDPTYEQMSANIGTHQYAAHGGLVVYGNVKTQRATGFHSTLTLGPIRYTYSSRLTWVERLELRFGYRTFNEWCREQVQFALENPLSESKKVALGLTPREKPASEVEWNEGA